MGKLCTSNFLETIDTMCNYLNNHHQMDAVELNIVWDCMGIVWDRMEPYGQLWNRMGLYGTIWALMKPYGHLWDRMGTYETVWALMGLYGLWDRKGTV